jgi:hypothetical protein
LLIYPLRFSDLAFVGEVFNEQIPRVLGIGQTTVFERLFCPLGILECEDRFDSVAEGVRIAFFGRRAWFGARGGLVDGMCRVVKDGDFGVAAVQRTEDGELSAETTPADWVHCARLLGRRGLWTVSTVASLDRRK